MSTCLGRVCLIVWRDARLAGLPVVHVNVNFVCSNSLIVPSTLIMYHPWHLQYILESTKEKICSKIVLDMCFYYLYLNWKQSKTHLVATWQKLHLSILPAMLIVIFYCRLQESLFTHLYLTGFTCVNKIQENVWTACDWGKNQEKTVANRFEVLVFDVLGLSFQDTLRMPPFTTTMANGVCCRTVPPGWMLSPSTPLTGGRVRYDMIYDMIWKLHLSTVTLIKKLQNIALLFFTKAVQIITTNFFKIYIQGYNEVSVLLKVNREIVIISHGFFVFHFIW